MQEVYLISVIGWLIRFMKIYDLGTMDNEWMSNNFCFQNFHTDDGDVFVVALIVVVVVFVVGSGDDDDYPAADFQWLLICS